MIGRPYFFHSTSNGRKFAVMVLTSTSFGRINRDEADYHFPDFRALEQNSPRLVEMFPLAFLVAIR